MMAQDQTEFGAERGNCFAACIASILEISVGEVPNFCADHRSRWVQAANQWLSLRGLGIVTLDWKAMQKGGVDFEDLPHCYCIASGTSPRLPATTHHSVVGRLNGTGTPVVVHDPHPDRSGLRELQLVDVIVSFAFTETS